MSIGQRSRRVYIECASDWT